MTNIDEIKQQLNDTDMYPKTRIKLQIELAKAEAMQQQALATLKHANATVALAQAVVDLRGSFRSA